MIRIGATFLLASSILFNVGCSTETTDDDSSISDLTGASAGSVYEKLTALTPLATNLKPRGNNVRYVAGNFEGTTPGGDVCNVSVYATDDGYRKLVVWEGTVDAYQHEALRDDQRMSIFEVSKRSEFRDARSDATSLHFSLKWIDYGDGERDHEVDVKAFDRPGGGVKVRKKKFGFDEVVECKDLKATGEGVAPPQLEGE